MPLTNLGAQRFWKGANGFMGSGVWLAFHTATPPTTTNEISGTDLPRIAIATSEVTLTGNVLSLNVAQDPANPTTDIGTAAYVGIWDAATAGNLLGYDNVRDSNGDATTYNIIANSDISIPVAGFVTTFTLGDLTNDGVARGVSGSGGFAGTGIFASFHSAAPTNANELTGSNLARTELTAAELDAAANTLTLNAAQTLPTPTANIGMATHMGFYSAATGGDILGTDTVVDASGSAVTLNIIANSPLSIPDAGIQFTMPLS